jgi:hypothetical protein
MPELNLHSAIPNPRFQIPKGARKGLFLVGQNVGCITLKGRAVHLKAIGLTVEDAVRRGGKTRTDPE